MTTMVETRTRPLTKVDLCDRCGVSAMKVARNVDDKELFFCAHHANIFEEALGVSGFYMDVETLEDRIN